MGRTPCEDEGRDGGDASRSQGMPNMASKPPEAKGETWIDSTVTPGKKRPVLAQESVGPFCLCYSHAPLPFNLTRPS